MQPTPVQNASPGASTSDKLQRGQPNGSLDVVPADAVGVALDCSQYKMVDVTNGCERVRDLLGFGEVKRKPRLSSRRSRGRWIQSVDGFSR